MGFVRQQEKNCHPKNRWDWWGESKPLQEPLNNWLFGLLPEWSHCHSSGVALWVDLPTCATASFSTGMFGHAEPN